MEEMEFLDHRAPLAAYAQQAQELFAAARHGDEDARWKFKWEHPRYRGARVDQVKSEEIDLEDAQYVVARVYGLENWSDLSNFLKKSATNESVQRFEAAADLVVTGETNPLAIILDAHPELTTARSARRHRATLLHYVAANGVEYFRQRTPSTAVEVAKLLLDRGAVVDALADMYDAQCTTMSMLVSSSHPAEAGLQVSLIETLLDYGAAFDGPGSKWQSSLMTALLFGFLPAAQALVRRGAKVDCLAAAAGLGDLAATQRMYPDSDELSRQKALALAAQLGQRETVAFLLQQGEDPNRFNPEGFHSHATPLHHAALAGHVEVVRLLLDAGANRDLHDKIYDATPLGWAEYHGQEEVVDLLRR